MVEKLLGYVPVDTKRACTYSNDCIIARRSLSLAKLARCSVVSSNFPDSSCPHSCFIAARCLFGALSHRLARSTRDTIRAYLCRALAHAHSEIQENARPTSASIRQPAERPLARPTLGKTWQLRGTQYNPVGSVAVAPLDAFAGLWCRQRKRNRDTVGGGQK